MNIEDLAIVFEGLSQGLGAGLKEKEKKELASLVSIFRSFPNKSIADFVKFVEGSFSKESSSFSKESNSVPALVERIKSFQQGAGEPRQDLLASLKSVKAEELKKILKALGVKPLGKKDDNFKLLEAQLSGGQTQAASPPPVPDLATEVLRAFSQYEAIKSDLRDITVEEMRARFAALANFPRPVLAGLLSKLGYPADGSRGELEAKLLDNLTSIKISYDQTRQIGS